MSVARARLDAADSVTLVALDAVWRPSLSDVGLSSALDEGHL
ncbi:MAG: hypothetical protein ACRDQ2_07055 [Gaiellales bacterium]